MLLARSCKFLQGINFRGSRRFLEKARQILLWILERFSEVSYDVEILWWLPMERWGTTYPKGERLQAVQPDSHRQRLLHSKHGTLLEVDIEDLQLNPASRPAWHRCLFPKTATRFRWSVHWLKLLASCTDSLQQPARTFLQGAVHSLKLSLWSNRKIRWLNFWTNLRSFFNRESRSEIKKIARKSMKLWNFSVT